MSTTVLIVAFPRTPFYGGPIRRAFRLSQRRGWFSRLVSLLLPLPLRVRSPLGVSSIGGKRAFLGGGAQVVRWGNGGRVKAVPTKCGETLRPFCRDWTLSRSVEDFLRFRGPPSSVWPSASHLPPCRGKAGDGRPSVPPLRRKTGRVRWLINARRGCGAAPGAIFHKVRPQWAGGNLDCYSDFARRNYSDQSKG